MYWFFDLLSRPDEPAEELATLHFTSKAETSSLCPEGLSQDTENWSVVVISSLMVGASPDSDDVKHSINYQKKFFCQLKKDIS